MSNPTIYIVTSGSYSDYGIRAVFTDKELADKFVETYNAGRDWRSPACVEEHETNPLQEMLRTNMQYFRVDMSYDGVTQEVKHESPDEATDYVVGSEVRTYMWARDEQHAVKIANDRRVQMIASGEFRNPDDPRPPINLAPPAPTPSARIATDAQLVHEMMLAAYPDAT